MTTSPKAPGFNSPLPRYSVLAICIRAAIYGARSERVQHMLERNAAMDAAKALDLKL